MDIDLIMLELRKIGCKCTAFFFNAGIGEWQFSVRDGGGSGQYSYGYGDKPSAAAMDALQNIQAGKPCTVMKLTPPKKPAFDLASLM